MNLQRTSSLPVFSLMALAAAAALTATISNLLVLLTFVVFLSFYGFRFLPEGVKVNNLLMICFLYVLFVCLTLIRERDVTQFFDILFEKQILLLVPFLFFPITIDTNHRKTITRLFIISVITAALSSLFLALIKFQLIENFYEFSWYLSTNSIFSSNYVALFIGFSLVILFHSFFADPLFPKPLAYAAFVFLLGFLVVLGSRMPFFAAALLILCYLYQQIKSKKMLLIAAIAMCFAIVLLIGIVPYFKSRVMVLFTVGFIADPRYYEYQAAWALIKEHFWLGLGFTGADEAMVSQFEKIGFHEGVANRYNSHNQFLQSFIIGGLPGFLLTIALYAVCLVRAIRLKNYLAISFAVFFTICSMTECLLERNKGLLFFGFLSGLFLISGTRDKKSV